MFKSAISGNISAGKSTLCNRLSQSIRPSFYFEESFQNVKYLTEYYNESQRNVKRDHKYNQFAYAVQLEFLNLRYQNELHCNQIVDKHLILDRCVFEDFHIFANSVSELGMVIRTHEL